MILLWHIVAPVIVTIVVAVAGARLAWPLYTILILVIGEIIAVAILADSLEIGIAAAIFVVVVPWAVVAGFVYLTHRLRHRAIVALLVLLIYLLSIGTSIVVGVNSGAMSP